MRSFSQLNLAIIRGEEREVKSALRRVDSSVSREDQGFTPLMWAVWHKHSNIFKTLLEHKANIDQVSSHGFTALDIAVRNNDTDFLKLLMSYKATLNLSRSPELYCAAIHDCKDVAALLLKEYKVDLNLKDESGETALMKAAYCGSLKVTKILLKFKEVNIYCKNKHGETSRDIAAKKKKPLFLFGQVSESDYDTQVNKGRQEVVKVLDEFIFKKQQNLLVFGLFDPRGKSPLSKLPSDYLYDQNTVKIVYDFLRPK